MNDQRQVMSVNTIGLTLHVIAAVCVRLMLAVSIVKLGVIASASVLAATTLLFDHWVYRDMQIHRAYNRPSIDELLGGYGWHTRVLGLHYSHQELNLLSGTRHLAYESEWKSPPSVHFFYLQCFPNNIGLGLYTFIFTKYLCTNLDHILFSNVSWH